LNFDSKEKQMNFILDGLKLADDIENPTDKMEKLTEVGFCLFERCLS